MKTLTVIKQRCYLSFALLICGLSMGCEFGQAPTVNESVAHDSLITFLDAWSGGETPDDLQPGIIGKDQAWSAGHKLVSYEIIDEKPMGTSLHISTKLTLENSNGVKKTPTATYIVGTSPIVTVFRDED